MGRICKMATLVLTFLIVMNYGRMVQSDESITNKPSPWAVEFIEMAKKTNLVPKDLELSYQDTISRQMFCTLIVQTYEQLSQQTLATTETIPFSDINLESVNKAYHKGIVQGVTETLFMPDENISRQELMAMLMRTIGFLESDLQSTIVNREVGSMSIYKDHEQVAQWAVESVEVAIKNDLLKGVGNNLLNPKGLTTVEEAIALLSRLATIVEAAKKPYFLDAGNYVAEGEWWYFDYNEKQLVKETTFKNIKKAYQGLLLKKDGTLYIDPTIFINTDQPIPLHKIYENGVYIESNWQPCELKCIIDVCPIYYSSNFIVTCLDGSVWECNMSDLTYNEVDFSEPIVEVKSGSNLSMALSTTGHVYFWGDILMQQVKEVQNVVRISSNGVTYRAQEESGTIWEWKQEVVEEKISLGIPKTIDLPIEQLDYYNNFQLDLSELPRDNKFIEFDDIGYKGCFVLDDMGGLYLNNNCDEVYNQLPLTIKEMNDSTFLDTSGSIWDYSRTSRAGGFAWDKEPTLIPGMKNGVIISDRLSLLSDGSIWSWELENYYPKSFREHLLGKLPEGISATDFIKIVHVGTYIYLLNNEGTCWRIQDYETWSKNQIGIQAASIFAENIKDIGYGFVLDRAGLLSWVDEENKLHPILESVQQMASEQDYTLALVKDGSVFYVGSHINFSKHEVDLRFPQVPFKIDGLDKITKIWNGSSRFGFVGLAEDEKNSLIGFSIITTFDDQNKLISKKIGMMPIAIKDYEELYFTGEDIIVKKKTGELKAWFIYEKFYTFQFNQEIIGPEQGFRLIYLKKV